jgi:hypothetical protein
MAVTVNVSPFGPKPQFVDWITGAIANGYQVFFYVAGSVNTKQATYTDSTGVTANANPLVLNSAGEPAQQIWFTQGLAYKVLIATPTDTDPPTNGFVLGDNLRGINDVASAPVGTEWLAGPSPAFISATSFSMTGDQTSNFQVNRRLKTVNNGGTIYSTISVVAFAAGITTVTVINDSGVLDSGISAVSYGLLAASNESIPPLVDTSFAVANSSDATKRVRFSASGVTTGTTSTLNVSAAQVVEGVQGASIASGGTISLDAATGDYVHVTGTTTIIGITLAQGRTRKVVFDGVLTLTNGASLLLPFGVSIVTSVGDIAIFVGEAAGVVRCISYTRGTSKFPTRQTLTSGSGAIYTTPVGATQLRIRASAGGGGSGGSTGTGGTGGTTTFNAINAIGGTGGGLNGLTGGIGGTGGTGTASLRVPGNGGPGVGPGGSSPFFGGGGTQLTTAGAANTGAGGSSAGNGGGGSGECFELIINAPAATYTYTIGAGGIAGTGAGATAGGTGVIIVDEYYN